jgi:hypothetical protein
LQYEYDRRFPVRGLYYDKLKGCLVKLDFFGSIEPDGCFFGRRKVRSSLLFLWVVLICKMLQVPTNVIMPYMSLISLH